jgi:hypothetical protein
MEQAMPKEFYTERDMEDLAKHGVQSLEINDNVVLTEIAFEKARLLGIRLVQNKPENRPDAPIRSYLSQIPAPQPAVPAPSSVPSPAPAASSNNLHDRILTAVHARLGNELNDQLIETIIQRVLASTGMK